MYRGGEASPSASKMRSWLQTQYSLRKKLIEEDDFEWKLPTSSSSRIIRSSIIEKDGGGGGGGGHKALLKYVGGVDVSFLPEDRSVACGSLVVLDLQTLQVVYRDYSLVRLRVPYIAGFLGFREVPILLPLIEKMRNSQNPYYPQVIMVDGNGKLHPRRFGSACHLGLLSNIPTIGVGKNLHYVDGLNEDEVRELLQARRRNGEDFAKLRGDSGRILGAALGRGSSDPIYISTGHRISLDTAINLVKLTRKFRLPEPVRQADLISREYIRNHKSKLLTLAESSWKTTTAIHLFNDSVEIGEGVCQGRGRDQGRRGGGRGGWQDRGQTENGGEGHRWHERGNSEERSEGQSNGRSHGRDRGRGPRGGGVLGQENSCKYVWVRKET